MVDWNVIRLSKAISELTVELHKAAHPGSIEECKDESCQKFRPKDEAQ